MRGVALALGCLPCPALPRLRPAPAQVRNYELGRVVLPDPGRKGPLPTRLGGVVGAPLGPGPHPVVLVLHGRHGTGCPPDRFDGATWPCFTARTTQRSRAGHVVATFTRRGFVALAPDLNAAFTDGWGEPRRPPPLAAGGAPHAGRAGG